MNRTLPVIGLAAAGLLALSACGSSGATSTTQAAQQEVQGGAAAGQAGAGASFPGASGKIAAKSGKTLQVQGSDSQTAVTYTGSTTITQQVTASLGAIKVGTCVMVEPSSDGSSSSSGSSSSDSSGPLVAATVRITPATNGSCEQRPGAVGGHGRPSGVSSGRPSGMPSGMPSDGAGGRRFRGPGGGFGAFGKVTAVTADGFTVTSARPDRSGSAGASSSSQTTVVSVTVNKSTTVTTTKKAGPTALKVGRCVTATGKTDDTGAVTAQRIAVSQPVDGECNAGFGFGGRGGAAQGAPQGSQS